MTINKVLADGVHIMGGAYMVFYVVKDLVAEIRRILYASAIILG